MPSYSKNFAMTGVGGFVAPRHLKAIHDTGNILVAAVDPSDSVGVLDQYFPNAHFFLETERFDRHLEKLRRRSDEERVHYLSVCSPNYLHDAHIRLALRVGADAICEKPLVIKPWNLDALAELEAETGRHVYTVLQLRLLPVLAEFQKRMVQEYSHRRANVCLTYITRRGNWYHQSWKGSSEKSGGLAMNIGIHFFDLLLWMFGNVEKSSLYLAERQHQAGALELERAHVQWFLSVDGDELPESARLAGRYAFRSITVDGQELEFSEGFTDLHTRVYEQVLCGNGFGIADARPSIELVHRISTDEIIPKPAEVHPFLA